MFLKNFYRVIHAFEMFVSYILPAILTFALDIRVLITRPPHFQVANGSISIEKQLVGRTPSGEKSNRCRFCIKHLRKKCYKKFCSQMLFFKIWKNGETKKAIEALKKFKHRGNNFVYKNSFLFARKMSCYSMFH